MKNSQLIKCIFIVSIPLVVYCITQSVNNLVYSIGIVGFSVCAYNFIYFLWIIAGEPFSKRLKRKKIEKLIKISEATKRALEYQKEFLPKSVELLLIDNPSEEGQIKCIDLYFKHSDILDTSILVIESQITIYKNQISFFYS